MGGMEEIMKKMIWMGVLGSLGCSALAVLAPVSGDTCVSAASVARKQVTGAGVSLSVAAAPAGSVAVSYLRFNLAGLPPGVSGADVGRATLWLYPSIVRAAGEVTVHSLQEQWEEGTLRTFLGLGTSAPAARMAIGLKDVKTPVAVDLTSLVRAWVDGGVPNLGIALAAVGTEAGGGAKVSFDSKESSVSGRHPFVEITLGARAGQAGAEGPRGPAGPVGAVGPVGSVGAVGPMGPRGAVGADGAPGPVGPMGAVGPTGRDGATGPQGVAGPMGRTGWSASRLAARRWFDVDTTLVPTALGSAVRPLGVVSDGDYVWVALSGSSSVRKFRRDGAAVLRVTSLGSTVYWAEGCSGAPSYLALTGDLLWVSRKGANSVSAYDADSGGASPLATVGGASAGFAGPGHLCFDGTFVWVANEDGGALSKIQVVDRTLQGSVKVTAPRGMVFDGSALWACSFTGNAVVKINPSNGEVLGMFAVGAGPTEVAFDGSTLWVCNSGGNSVTRLGRDGSVLGTFAVGSLPTAIVCDGRSVWVANAGNHTVSLLDVDTGAALGSYPSGGTQPGGLAFDGRHVWISNWGDGAFTRR